MENICKPIIRPSKKLQKMNYILILILLIFILLFILNYFYLRIEKSYLYIILSIILLEIIMSKYYKFVKVFTFALFISCFSSIIKLGLFLQNGFSITRYDINFYYIIFAIIFHIVTIFLSYELHKEMKIIYIEEYKKNSNGSELSDYNNKD